MIIFLFFCLFFCLFDWTYVVYCLVLTSFYMFSFNPLVLSYYNVGLHVDNLRFSLIYLTLFIFVLIFFSSQFIYKFSFFCYYYNFFIVVLLILLRYSFLVNSFLIFYFLFESSLIPTFVLILGWGLQPERLQASIYFFFYTLFISIPLLFLILYIYNFVGSIIFYFVTSFIFNSSLIGFFFLIILLMSFLIKIPLFLFHLWLPKAHVEAPVRGSMILAGVLLKLGGYGLCRVMHVVLCFFFHFSSYVFSLSLVSTVLVGIFCCRMRDIKALVAYSSVAHIGVLICSLFGFYRISFLSSLMVIIRHGITSSGLFMFINIIYERLGSRNIFLGKGIITIFPLISLFFFLLCASNFSTPPFVSLVREFLLMFRIINYSILILFFFPLGSFLGTVFCIYLFSFSQHGLNYSLNSNLKLINFLEYHSLFIHLFSLIALPFSISFFFGLLYSFILLKI